MKTQATKPKALDVGCANGAFLMEAAERGYGAVGIEANRSAARFAVEEKKLDVTNRDILACCFEKKTFDLITLHDVLEHFPDPLAVLKRLRFWIKPRGTLVIDVPDGDEFSLDWHHTKPREHLWFFRLKDLRVLLRQSGFLVQSVDRPIKGKLVVYCVPMTSLKIAVPPGIGDVYWALTKVRALKEKNGGDRCSVHICIQDGNPRRGHQIVALCPFVNSWSYESFPIYDRNKKMLGSGWVDEDHHDFRILPNEKLEKGVRLEDFLPELETHHFKPEISKRARDYAKDLMGDGRAVVFYMSGTAQNRHPEGFNRNRWKLEDWAALAKLFLEADCKPVLIGAAYDDEYKNKYLRIAGKEGHVDLTGKTSLEQALAVIERARCVVGFPSGIPILSTILEKPTVMFWNREGEKVAGLSMSRGFQTAWVPESILENGTYHPVEYGSDRCVPQKLFERLGCYL